MIDLMTLHIDYRHLPEATVEVLTKLFDRVCRYDPWTGDVVWETQPWESIASDSHTVAVRAGTDRLSIHGSPAKIMCRGDNTFGDPQHHSNMALCAQAMIDAASQGLTVLLRGRGGLGTIKLPKATAMVEDVPRGTDLEEMKRSAVDVQVIVDGEPRVCRLPSKKQIPIWHLSKLDITYNYVLNSLDDVRSALSILRGVEGGRYKVDGTAGDSVYWSKRSRRRKGKAYAKGPDLERLLKKGMLNCTLTANQLCQANRILRLELTVMTKWLYENLPCYTKSRDLRWWYLSEDSMFEIHNKFFGEMIGNGDVPMTDQELFNRVVTAAPSEGQGRAAWMTWLAIRTQGWQMTRSHLSSSTWYRHKAILSAAGLSDADLSHGQVVPLRRSPLLDMRPVASWTALCA